MLDSETKRRIDTARDILVGKVPDPKSQVEQITIALIYKFMDDMDAQAEELGGKRKFFAGDFAQYGWAKLMAPSVTGEERIGIYADGMLKMPQNPGVPPLFRNIFKNAYLPYRDPETLKSFLKTINDFNYDHSEKLGDAFEYLLSVLGSQGDAGQFRTPRHIIDFIVSIVDPKKNETVLDPACGTAGFMISAYKHIMRANSTPAAIAKADGNVEAALHTSKIPPAKADLLTPDERKKLADNFRGYDISPDMVRLSLVNMYLHGFSDPHVYEYDTLTSQDRWNEMADVILANPPFMSPKGGIKPHKRFSVPSKRSEVLFVDYMAEHLTPGGRAGIIVPEGVIFQSQTAYTTLRKMLVEQYLVAVVSLPAGVFNPYSGVKTSILILDKSLAKQSDTVGFFKVENDGFGLGAQRRPIDKNDLPQVLAEINEYLRRPRAKESVFLTPSRGTPEERSERAFTPARGLIVAKKKIAANGDFSLSAERYRAADVAQSSFPYVRLYEVCEVNPEQADPAQNYADYFNYIDISCVDNGSGKFLGANKIDTKQAPSRARRVVHGRDVLLSTVRPNLKAFAFITDPPERAIASTGFALLRAKQDRLLPEFLIQMLRHESAVNQMVAMMGKGAYPSINQTDVEGIQIPLPPLGVQKEIVAEVEAYQKVIDGARAVLDHYRPHIPIDSNWPIHELRDVTTKITDGAHLTPTYIESGVRFLRVTDITESNMSKKFIPQAEHDELIKRCRPEKGDVLYSKNGTIGVARLIDWDWEFSIFVSLALLKPKKDILDPHYLATFLNSAEAYAQATARSKSGTVTNLHLVEIKEMKIPLPLLAEQQKIVTEIEAEQRLAHGNRQLIERMEQKIAAVLKRAWGEQSPLAETALQPSANGS